MKHWRSQEAIASTALGQICLLVLASGAMHAAFLAINYAVCKFALRLPPREATAVLIMASQKTLPVAVTIIAFFPAAFGPQGLLTLPCIVGHQVQLFVDSAIASRLGAAEVTRQRARMANRRTGVPGADDTPRVHDLLRDNRLLVQSDTIVELPSEAAAACSELSDRSVGDCDCGLSLKQAASESEASTGSLLAECRIVPVSRGSNDDPEGAARTIIYAAQCEKVLVELAAGEAVEAPCRRLSAGSKSARSSLSSSAGDVHK